MVTRREAVERLLGQVVDRAGATGLSAALTTDPRRAEEIADVVGPIAQLAESSIDEVSVNGRRVDVVVRTPDRECRLVLSIDSDGVHAASAWERPPYFAGVPGGRAVIVNGPSSAGKSTAMDAVLAASSTPWVKFDELSFGTIDLRLLIWRDRAPTLLPGFVAGIAALAAEGNQVILTAGGLASAMFDELRRRVPTLDVGLDCPLEVRVNRQSRRPDRWGGLTESDPDSHEGWSYGLRFDTTTTSPGEIAAGILAAVPRG